MYITRKHLSRRTVLQGAGAAISLPLLDAMIPAATALAATAAAPRPRMGFIYFPHGAVMKNWSPQDAGKDFAISPILKPLDPYRSQMTIVSGLRNKGGESGDPHGIMAGTWLSCYGVKNREADWARARISSRPGIRRRHAIAVARADGEGGGALQPGRWWLRMQQHHGAAIPGAAHGTIRARFSTSCSARATGTERKEIWRD
jgi:hypothetical protein